MCSIKLVHHQPSPSVLIVLISHTSLTYISICIIYVYLKEYGDSKDTFVVLRAGFDPATTTYGLLLRSNKKVCYLVI